MSLETHEVWIQVIRFISRMVNPRESALWNKIRNKIQTNKKKKKKTIKIQILITKDGET